ncbi:transcription elongation factor GreB [Ferrovibrio terrae]|uniref:Transcription elongation factor GreB n=1 Tax=Ferrovibrio terrae TaxID=2594003 RepID=A0A516H755_9PROT|nr:transcription elongation factor GreB [Ferrovibrio terrae]QDO99550.1 transcription elongation factor GreB [Ferrovibrio terrae]
MSKAFTKESDAPEIDEDLEDVAPPIPAGAKNYITPAGLRRLQDELRQLKSVERPKVVDIVSWAAGNGDRSENGDYLYGKKRLREIDRRIRFLLKRLEIAEPVDPKLQKNREQVFFGATVTYEHNGTERRVRIVGIDEARLENGEVSWIAPIARALMKARAGDVVELRTPHGPEQIEVLEITYQDGDDAT